METLVRPEAPQASPLPGDAGRTPRRRRIDPADCFYLFAALLTLGLLARAIARPWLVADDYRANFFWLGQLRHPALFRGDLLARYFRDFQPVGIVALYALLTRLAAPVLVSKWFSVVVVVAHLAGARYLGRRLFADRTPRWIFAAWIAGNGRLLRGILGGFSRGFGPPLHLWFLGLLLEGRAWLALGCVALALLVHPISFATLGATFALWWLWEAWQRRGTLLLRAHLGPGMAALALATLGLSQIHAQAARMEAKYGPPVSRSEVAAAAAEWQPPSHFAQERPRGLLVEFADEATGQIHHRPFFAVWLLFAALAAAAAARGVVALRRGEARLPLLLVGYALAMAAAYEVAALAMPRFYMPNRYLFPQATVFAGALVSVGVGCVLRRRGAIGLGRPGRPAGKAGPESGDDRGSTQGWVQVYSHGVTQEVPGKARPTVTPERVRFETGPSVTVSPSHRVTLSRILATTGVALAFAGGLISTPPSGFGRDFRPYRAVAKWLRAHLAPGEMFAAFPSNDGDNLMTLAERPCLMTYECDHPIYSGYLRETRRRLSLLFRAYYAYSAADVAPLAAETPVRYLVVRREDVTTRLEGGLLRLYREPHGEEIQRQVANHPGAPSYWVGREAPAPVYQDRSYLVFEVRR